MVESLIRFARGDMLGLLRRETERCSGRSVSGRCLGHRVFGWNGFRSVEVVTIDEPAVIGSIGVSGQESLAPRAEAGEWNVARAGGVGAAAGWTDAEYYRITGQARYANYQLFSARCRCTSRPSGGIMEYDRGGSVTYPFFSDVQPAPGVWREVPARCW